MSWAAACVAILWLAYALLDRRWRIEPRLRDPDDARSPERIVAVVPARNEARQLRGTLVALLAQDHPGLSIVLVDDHSEDGTGEVAEQVVGQVLEQTGQDPKQQDRYRARSQHLRPLYHGRTRTV